MIAEPTELTIAELNRLDREQLIETLLSFTDFFSVQLTATGLEQYSTDELRGLLTEVQQHYRGKSD